MVRKRLKSTGLTGVILGAFVLLACELPIILAAIGLGSLGAMAVALRPSQLFENISIGLAIAGILFLTVYFVLERISKR